MNPILLITPPFTQLNTPYPATAYLKGFLNTKNIPSYQMDLGIEVVLELFSKKGLTSLFEVAADTYLFDENTKRIYFLKEDYIRTIDDVILFLQGQNPTLARQIAQENYLPEASRFSTLEELDWAFGFMGLQDKAKHLATLYLEDLSDFIVSCVDPHFGFSRYAEKLGRSANSFDDLQAELDLEPTYIDAVSWSLLEQVIEEQKPKLICFSVPFPGNLYSAFRMAQHIKIHFPTIKIAMGGGFPNTELRSLTEKKVFNYFDFITLDDGELPIELVYASLENNKGDFKRTFVLEKNKVVYKNTSALPDYKQTQVGTPDYSDLFLNKYISVIEVANPMHSLWSDGRWNKLTMAHGCYWGKCTFCDISLDYIKVYEPIVAKVLVDRMEELIAQTGENGFHFVDEAAPPALMRELALEILKRNLSVTWWTNIRFEKSFTADLCVLLQKSGCIAVSGGLEVASDRLLELIQKGVTVAQVAQVTQNFTASGIMVHSYLMYGYPTQTVQETIDSLEIVRQLFEQGIIQSGFWHQFAMTAHSPVGLNPDAFGVIPQQNDTSFSELAKQVTFANNDIAFKDSTGIDHSVFSFGLKKSLFNYMHGLCFDYPLQDWFDFKIPQTTIKPNFIENSLSQNTLVFPKPNAKIVWTAGEFDVQKIQKSKKGQVFTNLHFTFYDKKDTLELDFPLKEGEWLLNLLQLTSYKNNKLLTIKEVKNSFETQFENFELFWQSKPFQKLQTVGLLVLG